MKFKKLDLFTQDYHQNYLKKFYQVEGVNYLKFSIVFNKQIPKPLEKFLITPYLKNSEIEKIREWGQSRGLEPQFLPPTPQQDEKIEQTEIINLSIFNYISKFKKYQLKIEENEANNNQNSKIKPPKFPLYNAIFYAKYEDLIKILNELYRVNLEQDGKQIKLFMIYTLYNAEEIEEILKKNNTDEITAYLKEYYENPAAAQNYFTAGKDYYTAIIFDLDVADNSIEEVLKYELTNKTIEIRKKLNEENISDEEKNTLQQELEKLEKLHQKEELNKAKSKKKEEIINILKTIKAEDFKKVFIRAIDDGGLNFSHFTEEQIPKPSIISKSGKKGFHLIYFVKDFVDYAAVEEFFEILKKALQSIKNEYQNYRNITQLNNPELLENVSDFLKSIIEDKELIKVLEVLNYLDFDAKTLAGGSNFRLYVPQFDPKNDKKTRLYENIFINLEESNKIDEFITYLDKKAKEKKGYKVSRKDSYNKAKNIELQNKKRIHNNEKIINKIATKTEEVIKEALGQLFVETFKNDYKEGQRYHLIYTWAGSVAKAGIPQELAIDIYREYIEPLDRINNPYREEDFTTQIGAAYTKDPASLKTLASVAAGYYKPLKSLSAKASKYLFFLRKILEERESYLDIAEIKLPRLIWASERDYFFWYNNNLKYGALYTQEDKEDIQAEDPKTSNKKDFIEVLNDWIFTPVAKIEEINTGKIYYEFKGYIKAAQKFFYFCLSSDDLRTKDTLSRALSKFNLSYSLPLNRLEFLRVYLSKITQNYIPKLVERGEIKEIKMSEEGGWLEQDKEKLKAFQFCNLLLKRVEDEKTNKNKIEIKTIPVELMRARENPNKQQIKTNEVGGIMKDNYAGLAVDWQKIEKKQIELIEDLEAPQAVDTEGKSPEEIFEEISNMNDLLKTLITDAEKNKNYEVLQIIFSAFSCFLPKVSDTIFNPILFIYGQSRIGKSNLLKVLNDCFGVKWDLKEYTLIDKDTNATALIRGLYFEGGGSEKGKKYVIKPYAPVFFDELTEEKYKQHFENIIYEMATEKSAPMAEGGSRGQATPPFSKKATIFGAAENNLVLTTQGKTNRVLQLDANTFILVKNFYHLKRGGYIAFYCGFFDLIPEETQEGLKNTFGVPALRVLYHFIKNPEIYKKMKFEYRQEIDKYIELKKQKNKLPEDFFNQFESGIPSFFYGGYLLKNAGLFDGDILELTRNYIDYLTQEATFESLEVDFIDAVVDFVKRHENRFFVFFKDKSKTHKPAEVRDEEELYGRIDALTTDNILKITQYNKPLESYNQHLILEEPSEDDEKKTYIYLKAVYLPKDVINDAFKEFVKKNYPKAAQIINYLVAKNTSKLRFLKIINRKQAEVKLKLVYRNKNNDLLEENKDKKPRCVYIEFTNL